MRILRHPDLGRRDADQPEHFDAHRKRLPRVFGFVQQENLGELPADAVERIERGHRLLEDHPDPGAPHFQHLLGRKLRQILTFEQHLTAENFPHRFRQQAVDGKRRHTFPAAGLPDDAEGLALVHHEAHPIDRTDLTGVRVKRGDEVPDFEQRGGGIGHGRNSDVQFFCLYCS